MAEPPTDEALQAVLPVCDRWRAAYPLNLRHVEDDDGRARRGIVDHAIVHRRAIKIMPILAAALRRHRRPAGSS